MSQRPFRRRPKPGWPSVSAYRLTYIAPVIVPTHYHSAASSRARSPGPPFAQPPTASRNVLVSAMPGSLPGPRGRGTGFTPSAVPQDVQPGPVDGARRAVALGEQRAQGGQVARGPVAAAG